MDDLISRRAAIDAARHAWAKGLEPSQYIEIISSAVVEPVKRGKWINITGDEDSPRQCSACLQDFDYIDGLCFLVCGQHLPPYCPCCGAKMENK